MRDRVEQTCDDSLTRVLRERDLYKASLAQANLNFQEKVEELSLLRRLAEALQHIPDNKRVCQALLDTMSEQLGAPNSCLAVYQEESRKAILMVSTGAIRCKGLLRAAVRRWRKRSRTERSSDRDSETDLASGSKFYFRCEEDPCGESPGLYIPIEFRGSLLGIFYFEIATLGHLEGDAERILPIVSDLVASILLNVRLYHELAEYSQILERRTKLLEEMNDRLTRTQAQLVQSEKMAGIGLFAGGIAHEMNNPLMGIAGHLDLLIEENQGKPELIERLEVVRKQANRCSTIIHGLLDFARVSPDERSNVDINDSLEELLVLIEPQLRRQEIEIERVFAKQAPHVFGNRNRLQQVFMNILSNAQKAMPNGGILRLETGLNQDGNVVITFTDSGCGIPEENIEKVFDPFFTTADVGKGTGLGLAISFGIIREHGGHIFVESEPYSGTTFRVILPPGEV